jgi:hypothetical protein
MTGRLTRMLQGDSNLICCRIGSFGSGPCRVELQRSGGMESLWEGSEGLTGFGCD